MTMYQIRRYSIDTAVGTNVCMRQKRRKQYIGGAMLTAFFLCFLLASFSEGATKNELQAQIDGLMKQITSLQHELSLQSSTPPVALPAPTSVRYVFIRNLSLGSTGEDVKQLQIVLNADSRTRVRESGTGSPGNETMYFGAATKAAVAKFQDLYAGEILIPSGLARGSGFVGEKTRIKLALVSLKGATEQQGVISKNIPTEADTSKQVVSAPQNSDALYISGLNEVIAKRGGNLTLLGNGFDLLKNTLHIEDKVIENIPSQNGTALTFAIPLDLSIDKHTVRIVNGRGKESNPMLFIVTKDNPTPPVIQTLTPPEGPYGQKITITGQNFSLTNNDILSSYSIIEDVPSLDGKTLTFEILPFPEIPELQVGVDLKKGFNLPLYFYVVNENGISEKFSPGKFLLKI